MATKKKSKVIDFSNRTVKIVVIAVFLVGFALIGRQYGISHAQRTNAYTNPQICFDACGAPKPNCGWGKHYDYFRHKCTF